MTNHETQERGKVARHARGAGGRSIIVTVIVTALLSIAIAATVARFLGYLRLPGEAAAPAGDGAGKILFYRNPMNPAITSQVPAKDEMGMDYIPVYADASGKPAPEKSLQEQADEFFAEETGGEGGGGPKGLTTVALGRQEIELAGVQTVPAAVGAIRRNVRTVGRVVPDETRVRHVHTKVGGWVEKLHVNFSGQTVQQGKPLLDLYSPELLATQEEFLETRRSAARIGTTGTPGMRAEAEQLVAAARRRLELFDVPKSFIEAIERTGLPRRAVTLAAPVSGYVTSKGISEGQQVEPGIELYTITDLSRIWIDADLYEFEAASAREGQTAVLNLPYNPDRRFEGEIAYVYPMLDPETRTLRVRIEFPNPALALKPGMYGDVNLALESAEGVLVPESAIIDSGTRQVVFVGLGGGRFEPRLVKVGIRDEGKAVILAGVRAGEPVVVKANFLLDSESRLRALVEQATAARAQK